MGDLLNFSNHIDKQQTKNQYLTYEKLQVLEGTIESFINDIPDITDNEYISYFIKIVKKQIPVFEDKYFHKNNLRNWHTPLTTNYKEFKLRSWKKSLTEHLSEQI